MNKSLKNIIWISTAAIAATGMVMYNNMPQLAELSAIKYGDISITEELSGYAQREKNVIVQSLASGKVLKSVYQGQAVKKGELVLEIDDGIDEEIAALSNEISALNESSVKSSGNAISVAASSLGYSLKAHDLLTKAEDMIQSAQKEGSEYVRYNSAVEQLLNGDASAVSAQPIKSNSSNVQNKKPSKDLEIKSTRLQQLQQQLGWAKSYSEIDGVALVSVKQGQNISKGQNAVIIGSNTYEILASMDKNQLPSLKAGSEVNISVNGITYTASIIRRDDSKIYIKPPVNANLSENSEVKVIITLQKAESTCLLPVECVASDSKGSYIMVEENAKLVRKNVAIGINDEQYIEIIEGAGIGENAVMFPELYSEGERVK